MSKVLMITDETVVNKIYLIRGKKVMMDSDLAEMYGVETRRLYEQVKRNEKRFPDDFMFQLTEQELEDWKSQNATSNKALTQVFRTNGGWFKVLRVEVAGYETWTYHASSFERGIIVTVVI